jgi:hypothetical protein
MILTLMVITSGKADPAVIAEVVFVLIQVVAAGFAMAGIN